MNLKPDRAPQRLETLRLGRLRLFGAVVILAAGCDDPTARPTDGTTGSPAAGGTAAPVDAGGGGTPPCTECLLAIGRQCPPAPIGTSCANDTKTCQVGGVCGGTSADGGGATLSCAECLVASGGQCVPAPLGT